MSGGIYVSPTEFRSFADRQPAAAGPEVATRLAAGDLMGFFGLLPNPDPILKAMGKDIEAYQSLLVDPLIKGIRRRRSSAVLAMERGFDAELSSTPARVLKACEALVGRLNLSALVRDLLDGAFFGYRVGELMYAPGSGVVDVRLICKPGKWFGFDSTDGALLFKRAGNPRGDRVDPSKFVVVGKLRSWENPYGEPDLASCFWPVTFKRGGMKFWATFTEKYGMPWALGKLPRTAQPREVEDLADKLASMVRDAVAVIPDDGSAELIHAGGTASAEIYESLLMFCRSEISIALLGNNQSVEMQSNKASAEAAAGIEQHLRDDDAEMVADGINQVVRAFCAVNFPGAEPPVYAFWEQEEVDEVRAGRDEKLQRAGAVFTNAYFERTYNLEPGDLAERATPSPAPAPSRAAAAPGAGTPAVDPAVSFADPAAAPIPPDQAAIDEAIGRLNDAEVNAAMQSLLAPALEAIKRASTPEQVLQALLDAWPEMDASQLQEVMASAFFVADVIGRNSLEGNEQ